MPELELATTRGHSLESVAVAICDEFSADCETDVTLVTPTERRIVLTRPSESVLVEIKSDLDVLRIAYNATDLGVAKHAPLFAVPWKFVTAVVSPGSYFTWWSSLERDVGKFLDSLTTARH